MCLTIIKLTHRIQKICENKKKNVTYQILGTSEEQLKSLIEWITTLQQEEEKETIILYTPLLQNLSEVVAALLSGFEKVPHLPLPLPEHIEEFIKLIIMTNVIEKNIKGEKQKPVDMTNEAQWERILVIENIPAFLEKEKLR